MGNNTKHHGGISQASGVPSAVSRRAVLGLTAGGIAAASMSEPTRAVAATSQAALTAAEFVYPEGVTEFQNFDQADGYYGVFFGSDVSNVRGQGNGTILRMTPNTSTKAHLVPPNDGSLRPVLLHLVRVGSSTNERSTVHLSDMFVGGTPQGHIYNGVSYFLASGTIEDVEVVAIPGSSAAPPGETFSVNIYRGDGVTMRRCRLRDSGGSLLGINHSNNIVVEDCKFERSIHACGSATYMSNNVTFRNCVYVDNAYLGANNERCGGDLVYDHCVFFGHPKEHLRVDSDTVSASVRIIQPIFDGEKFIVRNHAGYAGNPNVQDRSDIKLYMGGVERPDLLAIID